MFPPGVVPSSLLSTNTTEDDHGSVTIAGVKPGGKIPRAKPIMPKQQVTTLQPRPSLSSVNLPHNPLPTHNYLVSYHRNYTQFKVLILYNYNSSVMSKRMRFDLKKNKTTTWDRPLC